MGVTLVGSEHAPCSDIGNHRGNAKGTAKPLHATSHDCVDGKVLFGNEGIFTNLFLIFGLELSNRFVHVDRDPLYYSGLRTVSRIWRTTKTQRTPINLAYFSIYFLFKLEHLSGFSRFKNALFAGNTSAYVGV